MKVRDCLIFAILLAVPGLCLAAGPGLVPLPYVLKAKFVVDGKPLAGVDLSYVIKVKSLDGTEFQPVDRRGSTFGNPIPSRFQYNIPTYSAQDQPGGAKAGQKACIEVYNGATKLSVTNPGKGSCPAGSGEITVLAPGDALGFGINGRPDDKDHSFPALTVVTPKLPGGIAESPPAEKK